MTFSEIPGWELDEEMEAALEELDRLNADPKLRRIMEERDYWSREIASMKENGRRQGIEEGIEEGKKAGQAEAVARMAKNLANQGVSIPQIAAAAQMTEQEIKNLLKK